MKQLRLFLFLAVAAMAMTAAHAQSYDFQNTKLKDDKRVELFLQQLTLDEKMMWLSPMLGTPRLGVPITSCYEGLHGLALGGPSRHNGVKTVDGKEVPNDLPTTIFPQAYGMGCTWDRSLIQRIGEIEAEEVRWYAQGNIARRKGLVVFAPNADLARDPRWGRTEESFGEDPYLVGQLSVAMVKGLQGDDPRYWKTAALPLRATSTNACSANTTPILSTKALPRAAAEPSWLRITAGTASPCVCIPVWTR